MSIRLMSAIFDSDTLAPGERLVMLALADHADEDGRCYPSIARLRQRTGMAERTVQGHIKRLTEAGYISVIPNAGRSLVNVYIVRATPAIPAGVYGAKLDPRKICTPAENDTIPPQKTTQTPAESAPKPSRTPIEPDADDARADQTLLERVCTAAGRPIGTTDHQGRTLGNLSDRDELRRWTEDLNLTDQLIIDVIGDVLSKRRSPEPVGRLIYFRDAMREAAARAAETPLTPTTGGQDERPHRPYTDRRQAAANEAHSRRILAAARARPASG